MNFGTTKQLLTQIDHFTFKLTCHFDEDDQTIKKNILGQQYEKNKFLVGVDIDDKNDEIIKEIERCNGINYFDKFCIEHKYYPYETLNEKTRSGGFHFYYYVDKDTLELLGKNKTDIYYDVNKKTSIDFKTNDGYFICSQSCLKYEKTEQKCENGYE